jgi:hypothetical protein
MMKAIDKRLRMLEELESRKWEDAEVRGDARRLLEEKLDAVRRRIQSAIDREYRRPTFPQRRSRRCCTLTWKQTEYGAKSTRD